MNITAADGITYALETDAELEALITARTPERIAAVLAALARARFHVLHVTVAGRVHQLSTEADITRVRSLASQPAAR